MDAHIGAFNEAPPMRLNTASVRYMRNGRHAQAMFIAMTNSNALIARISRAIDVPIETITKADGPTNDQTVRLLEVLELIQVFEQIHDRQDRRRCISFVKAISE